MAQDNLQIKDVLEQNTLNVIFYDDSFTKTTFFVKELSKWNIPIFYLDFDLLYSGFVKSGQTPLSKNTTLLCPNADSLHENLRSVIDKISEIKSLVIIDSLNGCINGSCAPDEFTFNTSTMQAYYFFETATIERTNSYSTGTPRSTKGITSLSNPLIIATPRYNRLSLNLPRSLVNLVCAVMP